MEIDWLSWRVRFPKPTALSRHTAIIGAGLLAMTPIAPMFGSVSESSSMFGNGGPVALCVGAALISLLLIAIGRLEPLALIGPVPLVGFFVYIFSMAEATRIDPGLRHWGLISFPVGALLLFMAGMSAVSRIEVLPDE